MAKRRMLRRVWMFWEQGAAAAPEIVRECLAAWPRLNPGWEVQVLDGASARRVAPRFAKLAKRAPAATPTKRSDLLRLELLARYGGVWADATLVPLRPLDEWLHDWLRPAGFFAFHQEPGLAQETGRPIATWFMASEPKNPLVVAWRNDWRRVWQCLPPGGGREDDFTAGYFAAQRIMLCTISTDPAARRVWNEMPVVVKKAVGNGLAVLGDRESAMRLVAEWDFPVIKCNRRWPPQLVAMAREVGLLPAVAAAG